MLRIDRDEEDEKFHRHSASRTLSPIPTYYRLEIINTQVSRDRRVNRDRQFTRRLTSDWGVCKLRLRPW